MNRPKLWNHFYALLFLILCCVAPISGARHQLRQLSTHHRALLQNGVALRLAWLARDGPDEELRELLEEGVDPDLARGGTPPIWRAAAHNNLETLRVLIEAGADVDAANRNGTTALYIAAQRGFRRIVAELIDAEADPNLASTWGSTPLSVAVAQNQSQIVELLIANGASATAAMQATQQSVLWTAAFNGDPEVVASLLENGADVNQTDSTGATPLYAATANRHLTVVEILLANTAGPDIPRNDGNTPLHAAAANCSVDIVSVLLRAGASADLTNADGMGALDLVCVMNEEEYADRLEIEAALAPLIGAVRRGDVPQVETLLDLEDPDLRVRSGKTALIYAAKDGDSEILELLMTAGADPDVADLTNWTSLHYAAYAQSASGILALQDADSDMMNNASMTPLMVAVEMPEPDLDSIQALIDIGAAVNLRSGSTGDTALHIAARYGRREVIETLLLANARRRLVNNDGDRPRDVVGDSADLTAEETEALVNLLSTSATDPVDPSEIDPGVSNTRNVVTNAEVDDDGDTFSTGDVIAFLLVPPAALFLCMSAFYLHQRRKVSGEPSPKKSEKKKVGESVTSLFPQFGRQRTVMDVDPHFRRTERDFELPSPTLDERPIAVSLVPHEQDVSLQLDLLTGDQGTTRNEPAGSGPQRRDRGIDLAEITPAAPVELAQHRDATVEETPRLTAPPRLIDLSDDSSGEFKDAKERFSTSGSLMSSARSDEFKDALEQPEYSSYSSERGTGTSEFQSADEGEAPVQRVQVVDSFALDSLGTTESRPVSSESAPIHHARTASSSEPAIDPVLQDQPEAPDRLQSFMVQSLTDTASIDSASLTNPTSREVSLEMEQGEGVTPEGGPLRVLATGRTTEDRPQEPESHQVPGYALQSFGSMFSEESRAQTESAGYSIEKRSSTPPSPEAHRVSIMSSRTSTESYEPERPPSVQGHQISLMSSQSSIESAGIQARYSEGTQERPPSVQGHHVPLMTSQSSIESAGVQGRSSEGTQGRSSEGTQERPPSVQGHQISIMTSQSSIESAGVQGRSSEGTQERPPSVQGHQISIMTSQSSIESAGMQRGSSEGTQERPPSVQGHQISIMTSQSSIESAGMQRGSSEGTQERPPSVQGHRISIMSSRTSTESYGPEGGASMESGGASRGVTSQEGPISSVQGHRLSNLSSRTSTETAERTSEELQGYGSEDNRPPSVQGHRISIMDSLSSVESAGMERSPSREH